MFLMSHGVNAVGGLLIMRDGNNDSVVNISESGTTDTVDLFFDPPVTKGGYPNPTADIIVTCTLQDAAQATLSPSTFTFNASNHGTPQTMTVTATDDADIEASPHSAVINCIYSSADPNWNLILEDPKCGVKCPYDPVPSIPVEIIDNDFDTDGDGTPDSTDPDDDGDNITDVTENGAPNGGDGNNDGLLDSTQSAVASQVNDVSGGYVTMVAECGDSKITRYDVTPESSNPLQDSSRDYNLGMNNFEIDCGDAGSTAEVTFFYDKLYDVSNWEYVKFDETQNIYRTLASPAAVFSIANNGVSDVTAVKLVIVDGTEDDDNLNSGTVADPSGPSVATVVSVAPTEQPSTTQNNNTLAQTGSSLKFLTLTSVISVVFSLLVFRKSIKASTK